MNTEKIKNDVELVYAIVDMDDAKRKTVTKSVFRVNKCVEDIFKRLMKDDNIVNHYSMCFQVITSDVYSVFLCNIVSPTVLKQDINNYIRNHEVSSELDSDQVEYMARLLFHLGIVICKHNLFRRVSDTKDKQTEKNNTTTQVEETENKSEVNVKNNISTDDADEIKKLEQRIALLEKSMNPAKIKKKVRWKDLKVSRSPPPPQRNRY